MPRRSLISAQIERWAKELVDLTRRNKLLYFRHLQASSFGFKQSASMIQRGLGGSGAAAGWSFYLPEPPADDEDDDEEELEPDPPRPDELVVTQPVGRYRPQIERGLKTLAAKSQAYHLDTGIWTLYLGLGLLRWHDGHEDVTSPLLLVPVRIEPKSGSRNWRLLNSDNGDSTLNPALALKLQEDFNITLPTLDQIEGTNCAAVFEAIRESIDRTPWTVEETAVLRTFTFHKEVIYQDLINNQDAISGNPLVKLLAEGPTSRAAQSLSFMPVGEDELDETHPPERLASILDIDGTQRQCMAAASAGKSFVMDGPPGTGKSQTIANLIAQLLQDNKTVLFVSEKAAALEVVYNRLAEAGLGSFLLSLHSHKATRKAVIAELGDALTQHPTATSQFSEQNRTRLERERNKLNSYAIAVNEVRAPFGKSLHDAVGRISQLSEAPSTPIPDIDTTECDTITFEDIRTAAEQLGRAWGPISRGDDFLWRDLRELSAGSLQESSRSGYVDEAMRTLGELRSRCELVHEELQLPGESSPSQAGELLRLLELIEHRPPIGQQWLVEQDLSGLEARIRQISYCLDERGQKAASLSERVSGWDNIDPTGFERFQVSLDGVELASPRGQPIRTSTTGELSETSRSLAEVATSLEATQQHVEKLASAFGYSGDITIELAERLARLGELSTETPPPESEWLSPKGLENLTEAQRELQPLVKAYDSLRSSLEDVFREDVLQLELAELRARFRDVHKGIKKLSSAYRQDKETLAATTQSRKATSSTISRLDEVISWQTTAEELSDAEERHSDSLGSYYPDKDNVDFDAITEAAELAKRAIEIAGDEITADGLASQLSKDAQREHDLSRPSEAIQETLDQLRSSPMAAWLTSQLSTLESTPINLAIKWAKVQSNELSVLVSELDAIDSEIDAPKSCINGHSVTQAARFCGNCGCAVGGSTTVEQGREVLEIRHRIDELDAELVRAKQQDEDALGGLADLQESPPLHDAINWVREVQTLCGGTVRQQSAPLLLTTNFTRDHLGGHLEDFNAATTRLLGEFEASYAADLKSELYSSHRSARELLDSLKDSIHDTHEWVSFAQSKQELCEEGLSSVLETCMEQRISGDQVPDAVEKAYLTRWVDQLIEGDERLEPNRAVDRDALRKRFQEVDRKLIKNAAAEVINSCVQRRPSSALGQAGVIQQQSQLKSRHKPLRKLFTEAGETVQRLKPCFMMSPLTVSQHIPQGMRFDCVIFDEASQVREADAICAIYRGDQLIVAGDQKQLPPTSFFDRMLGADGGDEEEDELELHDFESVLDRCKAQGFTPLSLRWHYRSRHEDLITFSNRSFYDSKLFTFPGAVFEAPHLGVELFKVDGVYARGGARTNPIEAATVVERILFHRRNHPDLSIGVVTLSAAQEEAVEVEIERRAASEPELDELITDDRLHGFFVKNLESVQGDERDIIILSVGYGPDENGRLAMQFGPINKAGGERRLNVAVTRARNRVEVVSSITGADIRPTSPSVRHFARYLNFAENGISALAMDLEDSQGDAESFFEEQVISSIRALGYEPVPQVGVAGYRIDIGIRHPEQPGAYLLGVECDGASYHSSRVARDRDRIRQEILEGLGWRLHRIWSTAWFQSRGDEENKLRDAIENAATRRQRRSRTSPGSAASPQIQIETVDLDRPPSWVIQYTEPKASSPDRGHRNFIDDSSRPIISRQIQEIVERDGPIHSEVVLRAIRRAWSVGRTGDRIWGAFNQALHFLVRRGEIEESDDFLSLPGQRVEVRGDLGAGVGPRSVDEVPPQELQLAIQRLLEDVEGQVERTELLTKWRGLFGWPRATPKVRIAFQEALNALVDQNRIDPSWSE